MIKKALIFALFLARSHSSEAISANQVVQSSFNHYPQVIESIQKLENEEQKVQEKWGSFDAKVKGEIDARTNGYYDGDHYKWSVEKPFPFFNSKVYGGKRQGFGDFPVYEGKYETRDQGEIFAGAQVSLLRNALIDMNRFNLRHQKQTRDQAEIDLRRVKINVQTMALKAYWFWFTQGYKMKVYQDILQLSLDRAQGISRRIKVGDLAKIYGTENNQYIQKRKADLINSQVEFQQASYYLSLFYRDQNGRPIDLSEKDLPDFEAVKISGGRDEGSALKQAKDNSLDLQTIESKRLQANLKKKMGTNSLLPKVDVLFEWNQDQGQGPNRLGQDENRVMLQLEVPLEYNKGLGQRRAASAELDQLKTKRNWVVDKIDVEVKTDVMKLNSLAELFQITSNQVQMAKELAYAERRKFTQGASDLILVNLREENWAEARLKNLEHLFKYQSVDSELRRLTIEFL